MGIRKVDAIKAFLLQNTHADLARLYTWDMQCTVYVERGNGERVEGEFKADSGKIINWTGYTDGITTWKHFVIPWKSGEYDVNNEMMSFDLGTHALGIGLSGWNWSLRKSLWVGFDFDSIIGHKKGLTDKELADVIDKVSGVDWVTVRRSTSGKGLHLYVMFDGIPTETVSEHAAVAKSVLNMLSGCTGYDFVNKVDKMGGNLWIWHRKMLGTDGLTLVRQGRALLGRELGNWKDYIPVVRGLNRRARLEPIEEQGSEVEVLFEDLLAKKVKVPLDSGHIKLINWLRSHGYYSEWRADDWMLITHTFMLKEAHLALGLRGWFDTIATGRGGLDDKNCYACPLPNGAWIIRRYNLGCSESNGWFVDGSGWTCCYYNRLPDLHTAARVHEGNESANGSYVFGTVEAGMQAITMLGGDLGNVPNWILGKECTVREHPSDLGRLVIEIKKNEGDSTEGMSRWIAARGKWSRVIDVRRIVGDKLELGGERYDDKIRHLITETGGDAGWVVRSDGIWRVEPLQHIKPALKSLGYLTKEIDVIVGGCIFRPWKIVHRPFEDVEESNREWNRFAPQYRWKKLESGSNYHTWKKVLGHIGMGLDSAVKDNKWCASVGIVTGEDYLKYWLASMLKEPSAPLPYLFLYGPQGSGKSILHEAIDLLITGGIVRADTALTSSGSFNGELEGSVLCVVEEVDLKVNKNAYNRLKDWVTSLKLPIHRKGLTPYLVNNTTHWIQCSNSASSVPLLPGDRRVVMIHVSMLGDGESVAKKALLRSLEKEAQAFLTALLDMELFESDDALNLPALSSGEKNMLEARGMDDFELFLSEHYDYCPGGTVTVGELYEEFLMWLEPSERGHWSKIRMGKALPMQYIKGRRSVDAAWCIGNIGRKSEKGKGEEGGRKLILKGETLHFS